MLAKSDPFLAEFDRLAHQVFGGSDAAGMPIDVTRRGDELVVRLDVPGVEAENIGLSLENHILTIAAERHPRYGDTETVLVQERFDGTMTRRLRVAEWVDAERVTADYVNGVLTVTLPIAEQAKPRRIEVRPSTAGAQATIGAGTAA